MIWKREPVMITATVAAVVQAAIIFGLVTWTDAQVETLLAAVNAVVILVAGGVARQEVSPYAGEHTADG